jgi:putative nucleotidyltransferase with HDIG domain
VLYDIRSPIGGWIGIAFWTALALVGSIMPVRLPKGIVVNVSAAPILAAITLGGPMAAAVVAAVGTTDDREVRREVPWYGSLFNHAAIALPAVIAGVFYEEALGWIPQGISPALAPFASFAVLLVASAILLLSNLVLTTAVVSSRDQVPLSTVWTQDIGGVALSLFGLSPLGWLMAQIFLLPNGVGWWATALFVVPLITTRLAYQRYVETRELFEQTIRALAKAVDARDKYTRGHSGRVSRIAEAMCRVMKLPEGDIEIIKWAGLLHDIGKIGVRDNILLKEGPLDKEERILMNQHPVIGARIVSPAKQLGRESPLIRQHHEWFNGSGYPDGLQALDIELGARVLGVADAYEAMTSARPYRKTPLTHEQAVGELRKYSGIQFDPDVVPVLIGLDRETLDRNPAVDDEVDSVIEPEESLPIPPTRPAMLPERSRAPKEPPSTEDDEAEGNPEEEPRAAIVEQPRSPEATHRSGKTDPSRKLTGQGEQERDPSTRRRRPALADDVS